MSLFFGMLPIVVTNAWSLKTQTKVTVIVVGMIRTMIGTESMISTERSQKNRSLRFTKTAIEKELQSLSTVCRCKTCARVLPVQQATSNLGRFLNQHRINGRWFTLWFDVQRWIDTPHIEHQKACNCQDANSAHAQADDGKGIA